jgi:hypothetical protein
MEDIKLNWSVQNRGVVRLGTVMGLALLLLVVLLCGLQGGAPVRADPISVPIRETDTPRTIYADGANLGSSAGTPAVLSSTVVGGSILTNTVWQGEVLVEETVSVQSGVTLTVQPGTQVRFKHYRGYREPEKRLSLQVFGTLIAEGTTTQPIYFTSDASDPQNGDWSMIRLGNSTDSVLRYCVVEFGQQGINVWGGSPEISNCVIRWHNWEGLYFESYAEPTIEYCHIVENGYNGLAAEQFNTITMDYCEIERSGTHGLHIDASTGEIRRSRVHNNRASGLSVDNNGTLRALGVAIADNNDCGIAVGEGINTVQISNLTFSGNAGGDVCGSYITVTSAFTPPISIDIGFTPTMSYALGYIPGDPISDTYMYVYPDDETRRIVRKIGDGLGLTWSLAWDGQYIWTSTLWGTISKLNPQTGTVVPPQFTAPGSQPWGMTFDGEHLWVVDFAERRISKLDPTTGTELATYPTPDPVGGCKGVTWDGSYLYVMGWTSPVIYKMDRQGQLIDTIPLGSGGGGIAWDGQHFWVPGGGKILKYDKQGHNVGWIYAASEGTWDMTWDGQYLWASQRTNENWSDRKIFALEILEDHDHYANPETLYVDGTNPNPGNGTPSDPYRTITQAVSAGFNGDRILVAQDTYTENLTIDKDIDLYGGYASYTSPISWTRNITLYETIIDGNQSGSVVTFQSNSDVAVLDGFTITGGDGEEAGGVHAGNANVTIHNCLIHDNFADGSPSSFAGGGVLGGFGSTQLTIIDSRIINNQVNQGASGVRVHGGTLSMTNTLVADNHGDASIHVNGPATLMNVTVVNNDGSIIFNPQFSATLAITNSIVYSNVYNLQSPGAGTIQVAYADIEGGWTGTGNIDADPGVADAAGGDYHLQAGSPCIDAGTSDGAPTADIEGTPRDAFPDMGAYEWTGFRIFLPLTLRNFGP